MPAPRLLPLLALLVACSTPVPTAAWQVSVVSGAPEDFSGCLEGEAYDEINDSFLYEMFLDESQVFDLRIDGQTFATGSYVDGCTLEYESPAFLTSYDEAEVQWQLTGSATAQGAAGGCPMQGEGTDWEGQELATVTRFGRVQFTPDLMPADVTGSTVFLEEARERRFEFQPGPVFHHVLLADEINRATPKTQSALLEAMQERAVTVGGVRHELPDPFVVLATQNPIEMEGTYPLPEAQLDRFLIPPPG
jgi:hypothetical protein